MPRTGSIPSTITRSSARASSAPTASPGFNTPTGRIELYSTLFGQWGQTSGAALRRAYPTAPTRCPSASTRTSTWRRYPLIMTTGARHWALVPFGAPADAASARAAPEPGVRDRARRRPRSTACGQGDWCWIENHLGPRAAEGERLARARPVHHLARPRLVVPRAGPPRTTGGGCYGTYVSNAERHRGGGLRGERVRQQLQVAHVPRVRECAPGRGSSATPTWTRSRRVSRPNEELV